MREFDYELPARLIAQTPLERRSDSRLLVLDRSSGAVAHRDFDALPELLSPGDLLVVNDTRVIPARLLGHRRTGGSVEVLLLRKEDDGLWRALIRPAKRLRAGEEVVFISNHEGRVDGANAVLAEKLKDGEALVRLDEALENNLQQFGRIPLPPYVTEVLEDDERYQTVFAARPGSAAAPTAGLHFTSQATENLKTHGIQMRRVTLHVGLDTFRPVTEEFAENHLIHEEWCAVPEETARAVAETKERGKRVIAVGTTVARVLESYAQAGSVMRREAFSGMTGIYITPGYTWKAVDAIITNFHLPRSSLLLMISAFAGRDTIMRAYREAIAEEYRFYSFGDAMLIL